MRTSAILLIGLFCVGCADRPEGGPATALVASGTTAQTPLSGASRASKGTIDSPDVSQPAHREERGVQRLAVVLEGLGYEELSGIDVEDQRFTADAARGGRPLRLSGTWIDGGHRLDQQGLAEAMRMQGYSDVRPGSGSGSGSGGGAYAAVREGRAVTLRFEPESRLLVEEQPAG